MTKYLMIAMLVLMTIVNITAYEYKKGEAKAVPNRGFYIYPTEPPIEEKPKPEQKPNITTQIPTRELSYDEVNMMIDEWHKGAPEITEVGTIGNSHRGKPIRYIRIGKKSGPKVLITAAIHGNEKLSTMATLGTFNRILSSYMVDERVTDLLRTRDVFFIPIVSPEGFINNSRHTMRLDPNRNFNGRNLSPKSSIPCVQALKDFHKKHEFNAVMSCHNYGRLFFYPWGYTRKRTSMDEKYRGLLSRMTESSGYRYIQLHGRSSPPYYGYEVDWFHENGAFAVVNEIGTSFRAMRSEILTEANTNYEPFLLFIREAPLNRDRFPDSSGPI